MPPPVRLPPPLPLLLALALPPCSWRAAATPPFAEFHACDDCVAAGYGWSLRKAKCGMFANRECPTADAPTPPAALPPGAGGALQVTFADDGPLGLKFGKQPSAQPEGWDHVAVASVQAGSAASRHAALVPGLVLETINGVAVRGLRYTEAIQLLKATPRPLTLTFLPAPPPGPPPSPASRQAKETARRGPAPGTRRDVGPVLAAEGSLDQQRSAALAAYASTEPCRGLACYTATLARDLAPWSEHGGISRALFQKTRKYNIDKGRMNHYQILKGRLYRSGRCPSRSGRLSFHPRCEGIEHTLLELLAEDRARSADAEGDGLGPRLPEAVEFIVNVNDKPQMAHGKEGGGCLNHDDGKKLCTPTALPLFSFSKPQHVDSSEGVKGTEPVGGPFWDIMYPAWTFWGGGPFISVEPNHGLGRWDKKREAMIAAGEATPWERKKPQAFFRGSRTTPQRDPLVRLTTTRPELAHAHYTKNQASRSLGDTLGLPPAEEMPLEGHCEYRYLFNFKGMAASFRYKHLFLCRSLVFHVGTPGDDFVEFFQEALVPWVHYVPVSPSLEDLEEKIVWAQEHDAEAQAIAQAGLEFVRDNLRYEDVKQYWRALLAAYGKLLRWKVTKHRDTSEITTASHSVVDREL